MDWNTLRSKRMSISGIPALAKPPLQPLLRFARPSEYSLGSEPYLQHAPAEARPSCYTSQHPLFCADWTHGAAGELVALGLFREGFQNRIQIVSGRADRDRAGDSNLGPGDSNLGPGDSNLGPGSRNASPAGRELGAPGGAGSSARGSTFDFACVAETLVDYPATALQWEPHGHERLAVSSEVLRLYKLGLDYGEPALVQTHMLANNSTANAASGGGNGAAAHDINTFPPVTSFDWNAADPSIVITLSVDTTCTVWDLSRSHAAGSHDTAHVKTQLIAHDLEVFDVKFLHMSTNVFASVSNDGSMRAFDLRSLEHSTIIYEPTGPAPPAADSPAASAQYNPQALLRLLASCADQHHLATVGVNLNQVLIIDLRMPGVPVVTIDGLFDGQSSAPINLLQWHPTANLLATGGDDCQALVWDCSGRTGHRPAADSKVVIDTPVLAYSADYEVNTVCWRRGCDNWMGVVSGKGFQALETQ
ncbi:WD40 repeat-like protein [Metschnikowia bicuspidata var. bicuspidata NRRL YB-4993]|uniref:WD40 repeat-like protein n=1 Tax=Metschnikowia bicuspidata var. bicuspidata NRRL YB-4993 TaxID=869754 RepID=A0A1A0HEX9_9ASCO|nr:WD40 repeat-like protein [Metschnikowia bicuspidata var. bicuspidata NRRL YB-4993]OBA22556.1 WD40 repeat-like protein [Metschnikowia bicuspidata var. bicuspidata NRRL YB-4993]